jgi:hypothetical protein
MEPDNPHRGKVVDLVNPYMNVVGNQQGGKKAVGLEYALWWLTTHPGRWALIGENGLGSSPDIAMRYGLVARTKGGDKGKVYAQMPHPEGEPLNEALHRSATLLEALPALTRDPFNWTPAELADAVQCARENLFPVADKVAS